MKAHYPLLWLLLLAIPQASFGGDVRQTVHCVIANLDDGSLHAPGDTSPISVKARCDEDLERVFTVNNGIGFRNRLSAWVPRTTSAIALVERYLDVWVPIVVNETKNGLIEEVDGTPIEAASW